MRTRFLLASVLAAAPLVTQADAQLQAFVERTVAAAREQGRLPAVAALVQIDGRIEAATALGVRALAHPQAVTIDDRWHIGSDTKAITATLIARLVEQQVMRFDDTLATSFPALARDMHPAYRAITVQQLLSHAAGLPPLTDDQDLPPFLAVIRSAVGVQAQRAAIARHYLSRPPASAAGEFAYSNLGYIIAGAIAEAHTGRSWEDLVREQVFVPLGIQSAGFGAPGSPGRFDQPRGHRDASGTLLPLDPADPDSDNPPALGPAGTIHLSLPDWMRFAQDQLDGVHGRGRLLQAATYRRLHTPVNGPYALGWGARLAPDGAPALLTHSGSNGYWIADIRLMPQHDTIVLLVTNAGNEAADRAIRAIRDALNARLQPFD